MLCIITFVRHTVIIGVILMPIYDYFCKTCDHSFDVLQKISEPKLIDCPKCGESTLKKMLSAPKFRLKGKGWYETDFKTGNKPRRDEWNDEYYLQLGAYSLAHDKVYGTNIKQGVILLCTKDLMFQRFVVDSERLKKFQQIFLDKVNQYYEMQLNN